MIDGSVRHNLVIEGGKLQTALINGAHRILSCRPVLPRKAPVSINRDKITPSSEIRLVPAPPYKSLDAQSATLHTSKLLVALWVLALTFCWLFFGSTVMISMASFIDNVSDSQLVTLILTLRR